MQKSGQILEKRTNAWFADKNERQTFSFNWGAECDKQVSVVFPELSNDCGIVTVSVCRFPLCFMVMNPTKEI